MNAFKLSSILTALAAALAAAPASAEGLPSSKATADINTLVKCHISKITVEDGTAVLPETCVNLFTGATVDTTGAWIPIMEKKMKLSNSQSIFLSPSLVTGLYTRTRTKTTTGTTSTAQAMGGVYLRAVLVPDAGGPEIVAAPISSCGGILGCVAPEAGKWGVELDTRIQTLTQALSACVIDVTSIEGTNDGTCTFTSTIDLVLKTTSAHTFNFIFPNVGQGTYTIKVSAAVGSDAQIIEGSGSAVGAAAFGLGSMLVESVRLVHDFDF